MRPSLNQLSKILKNEVSHRYTNKAVIGGLPKLLSFWEPNARRDGLEAAFVEAVAARVRAYPELPETERPAAIQDLLRMVDDAAGRAAQPEKPKPAATPARPAAVPARPAAAPTPPLLDRPKPAVSAPKPPEAPAPPSAPPAARLEPAAEPSPAAAPAAEAAAPSPRPEPEAGERQPPRKARGESKAQAGQRDREREKDKGGKEADGQRKRADYSYLNEEPLDPRPRRAPPPRPLKTAEPLDPSAGLDAPLTVLHGIGPERARDLERLGLATLRDALLYFPRRYDNYARMKTINRLEYGEECSVIGQVTAARERKFRGGSASMLKLTLADPTGSLEITFFNSQPWMLRQFEPGRQIVVAGRIDQYLGRLTLTNPDWEALDRELLNTGRIAPVYRLTEGVNQHALRRITGQVVEHWARRQPDPLPPDVLTSAQLMPYGEALAQVHFPDSEAQLAEAQHRLAFDELLLLQLGVLRQRREWQSAAAVPLAAPDEWLAAFSTTLPYALTAAQQRALADVRADLAKDVPMNRLLQGDVGSGKTVVAAAAMALAVQAGAQAALMAPTSILAEQHHRNIAPLLQRALDLPPDAVRLLQGATPAAEKDEVHAGLRAGTVRVVIGTHALIESPVEFARLGLVVVDEQHRFGVAQRAALRSKGASPHLLAMTATPIPRTLALTVYGDLDLSVLDELPPGRQPIETHVLHASERERGYAFVRSQVQQGRQAFLIFPLVETSEKSEARAAVAEHARLQKEVFPEFSLGLVHGRLRPEEKDEVMAAFRAGQIQILVSTSVVEVGVDVPNASVMVVEGANRFGLSQLHQFRGRVGRGEHRSTCLLISDAPVIAVRADERLVAMEQSQDGFQLAEKDLELRGPGDFLGVRQSGWADLRLARLSDVRTIEKARREAQRLFERDPGLTAPEHQGLAERLQVFWTPGAGDAS